MHQYLQALKNVRTNGQDRTDRTGTGTRSLFGRINMEFDLTLPGGELTVPLLNSKKVNFDSIKEELNWMLEGQTNVRPLQEKGVKIWNEWAKENGELGPIYGYQWRKWPDQRIIMQSDWEANKEAYIKRGFRFVDFVSIDHDMTGAVIHRSVDQIAVIENQLRNSPDSRRIILTGWNVAMIEEMSLPPCHTLAQWYVSKNSEGRSVLDCKMYQRSGDMFLGVPFNIVQYSLLTHMLAKAHGMLAGKLYHTLGDAHIYSNHMQQVDIQLSRHVDTMRRPVLHIDVEANSVLDIKPEHISVTGYDPMPYIPAPVAV